MRYNIGAIILTMVWTQITSLDTGSCIFGKNNDVTINEAIQRLQPLIGNRYSLDDNFEGGYTYKIGICASVGDDVCKKNAGVVQQGKSEAHYTIMVGNVTQSQIMGGSSWILLEYKGGKNYGSHCNKESRRASIMITCAEGETEGKMKSVLENFRKVDDCYYLFEMEHDAVCPQRSERSASGRSTGSVVAIIFLLVFSIYLLRAFIFFQIIYRKLKAMHDCNTKDDNQKLIDESDSHPYGHI